MLGWQNLVKLLFLERKSSLQSKRTGGYRNIKRGQEMRKPGINFLRKKVYSKNRNFSGSEDRKTCFARHAVSRSGKRVELVTGNGSGSSNGPFQKSAGGKRREKA